MSLIKKILLSLGIAVAGELPSATATERIEPDFAHPRKVISEAYAVLKATDGRPDAGPQRVRAFLEICKASTSIDPDSLYAMIDFSGQLAAKEKDGSARALLEIAGAGLLNNAYQRKRWVYDRLETPDEPLPEKITEWNGRQFRAVIESKTMQAYATALANPAPLMNYSQAVEADARTLQYYPDVADFVALEAARLLRGIDCMPKALQVIEEMKGRAAAGSASFYSWTLKDFEYTGNMESADMLPFYLKHRDDEYARMILCAIADCYDTYDEDGSKPDRAEIIALVEESLERFPNYWDNNSLQNALSVLRRGRLEIKYPMLVCPGVPFEVEMTANYAKAAEARVYGVTRAMLDAPRTAFKGRRPLASIVFPNPDSSGPATAGVPFTLDSPGVYVLLPEIDGVFEAPGYFGYLTTVCTPYIPVAFSGTSEQIVAMADFTSGRPIKGVRVLASKHKGAEIPAGTTDEFGLARFRLTSNEGYTLSAVTPTGEKLFFGERLRITPAWRGKQHQEQIFNVSLMTARPIYHPGDTLRWLAVADCSGDGNRTRRAAASLNMTVRLADANGEEVAETNVVTDTYGRADGEFAIPSDGLSGNFSLIAEINGRAEGYGSVMVSDYRMPTFEITGIDVRRDVPKAGDVSVSGRAVTYSGMPVADAKVTGAVSEAVRWRWWQPSIKVGQVASVTDASGGFTIVVPGSMLEESSVDDFAVGITVTSSSAETAAADAHFTTGKPYLINVAGNEYLKAETRTVLPVSVYDANGEKADIALLWRLEERDGGRVAASGKCGSLSPVANLETVRGGYYHLVVEPVDTALADGIKSPSMTLYNVGLNSVPADLPLLVAVRSVKTNASGRASFQYGVGMPDTWLYAALCVGDEIVEAEVQKRSKGFRHISLDLPAGAERGTLKIFAIRNGRTYSYSVDLIRPDESGLTIEGTSFRDRLVPGGAEHWSMRVARKDGTPVEAAVAATMYNHSLDALSSLRWPSDFARTQSNPELYLDMLPVGKRSSSVKSKLTLLKCETVGVPEFRYSGVAGYGVMIRGRMMNKMAAPSAGIVEEEAAMDLSSLDECVVVGSVEKEENGEGREPDKIFYRDAEVADAFWMPELTTDTDGALHMNFNVPEANTTWRFRALAWTEEMDAGEMVRDIVANKPVMVQPNLPRFLREGDHAVVLATVFNNSSDTTVLHTVVELFDPATMKVVAEKAVENTVAPDASAIVPVEIAVADDAVAIGYRVRCDNGSFSDGEQALIPVMSAQCDVIESVPFYLNPGDKELKIKIPAAREAEHTLQFCSNPSWSVVKALPGLIDYEPRTVTDAVYSLYAACTAHGIVERVPQIAEALRTWDKEPLASRLAQNDALKIAALRATPWVQAAQSDSERMARLSLLLDSKHAEANVNSAVKVLESLACSDGGFRWGKWSVESSQWATETAAHTLGLLRMAGYMPENKRLLKLMHGALAYMDRCLERDMNGKAGVDMGYAVVRSMWKDVAPSAFGDRVVKATLQYCIKNWREAATVRKADMAILLGIYGYTNVASQIIGSLDEFAVASPSQGVSFPSVYNIESYAPILIAYGRIKPQSALIDGMRQWLVVREQATVGLGAADATQLVGAFLNNGTPWHTDNAPAAVTLRGQSVNLGDACSYGGEATVALGSDAGGATLRIAPGAGVPSYGAVISSYRARPQDVKAASCDAVSVEKRMVAVLPEGTAEFADTVELGTRVRVLLTLHVARDMEYVTIVDERAAALEPLEQTPGYVTSGGARFYRENRNESTNLFISYLPKGTYQISYDCTANNAGSFAGGLATVQSALAPSLTAHSSGSVLIVR